MRIFRRGDVWYCYVYEGGVRRQVSTRCHDKKAAEAVARQLERRAADPGGAAAKEETVTSALERLILARQEEAKAGRKSEDTVEFYRAKAGHLLRLFGGDGSFLLAGLHARDVDAYISARRSEGVSESTIHKELITLRASLKLALRAGTWSGVIDAIIPPAFAPEYKPRQRFLSHIEVRLLLAELTADHAARVAFIVATSACWRETELARREDVSEDKGTALIRGTKRTTRFRTVPIVLPEARELLEFAVDNAMGKDGLLFLPWINVRRDIHAACLRAGRTRAAEVAQQRIAMGKPMTEEEQEELARRLAIPPCSPNDLRRTCATWLRAAGVRPDLIAPVMGHADTRMVERVYGRLPVEDLRRQLAAAIGSDGEGDCITGASEPVDSVDSDAPDGQPDDANRLISLPRAGIEPATRGFSIPAQGTATTRKDPASRKPPPPTASPVHQPTQLRAVQPRTRRRG